MSYIRISNNDGTYSLVHSDDEGAYLAHHGVKNQRWGVRRFQNPDGSLTQLGAKRRHYQTTLNDLDKKYTKGMAQYMRTNAKLAKSDKKTSEYLDKYEKDKSSRNKNKAEKSEKKSAEFLNKSKLQAKSIKDTDSKIRKTTDAALKSGYNVSARKIYRNHDIARNFASIALFDIPGLAVNMAYNKKKYGHNYPAKNPNGSITYQNPMMVQGNKYHVTKNKYNDAEYARSLAEKVDKRKDKDRKA